MAEDQSYNLINIQNFSTLANLEGHPNMDDLFTIFQIGLTLDVSINDIESFSIIDISMSNSNFANLNNVLKNNEFERFYNYLVIDLTIDETYEKFKTVLEKYPSILIRRIRNVKIKKTDFLMLEDFALSETEKQSWIDYRRQLRDITNNYEDNEIILNDDNTFNIEWPTVPNTNLLLTNGYYLYD